MAVIPAGVVVRQLRHAAVVIVDFGVCVRRPHVVKLCTLPLARCERVRYLEKGNESLVEIAPALELHKRLPRMGRGARDTCCCDYVGAWRNAFCRMTR